MYKALVKNKEKEMKAFVRLECQSGFRKLKTRDFVHEMI